MRSVTVDMNHFSDRLNENEFKGSTDGAAELKEKVQEDSKTLKIK